MFAKNKVPLPHQQSVLLDRFIIDALLNYMMIMLTFYCPTK